MHEYDIGDADDVIPAPVLAGPGYDVVLIDRAALTDETAAVVAALCDAGVAKPIMSVQSPELLGLDEASPPGAGALAAASLDDLPLAEIAATVPQPRRVARPVFRIGDWEFRPADRLVSTPEHRRIVLTGTESRLLHLLASHRSRILSRQRILRAIFPTGRCAATIDSHVHAIRAKTQPSMIRTVHGLGYCLGTT